MDSILVIQTASIGDVILSTALLEQLHEHFPHAKIDLLVKKGHETLFKQHPFLNAVLVWDKRAKKYQRLFHLLRKIRRERYHLVINIQRFGSTGVLTALSGAKRTIGFSKNPFSLFFTDKVEHQIGSGIHEVERNQALLSLLIQPSTKPRPRLYPSVEDEKAIEPYLSEPFYTISPASLWFTKQFPVEKWVELIQASPADTRFLLLGSESDKEMCTKIVSDSTNSHITSLAGKLTLLQSTALMKHARMNFTNDSAPMHLASSVNAPVTVVFCSTTPEFGFGPLSDQSAVVEIRQTLDCRPCGLHGFKACPKGHFRCAYDIQVAELVKFVEA